MQKAEIKQFARALIEEMGVMAHMSLCEWITEAKVIEEFPLTKCLLERYRNDNDLQMGYHYKALSNKDTSKGGTRRGKKSYVYHRNRLNEFIEAL